MASTTSNNLLVIGGTGQQGFGVIAGLRSLDENVSIRTVTRDPSSDKAKRLINDFNVELIEGDFSDEELMRKALKGVDSVFLNLDYWTIGFDKEITIGKQIVRLCKESGVKYVVYSNLEPIGRVTGHSCPWFDSKIEIADEIVKCGFQYHCFVKMSLYCENFFKGYTKIAKDSDGKWKFAFPLGESGLTLVPVHDIGRVIAKVLLNPEVYNRRSIGLAGDHLSGREIAGIFTQVTGEPAKYVDVPMEEIESKSVQGATMWKFKREHEDLFKSYVKDSREIVPDVQNFKNWLEEYLKNNKLE